VEIVIDSTGLRKDRETALAALAVFDDSQKKVVDAASWLINLSPAEMEQMKKDALNRTLTQYGALMWVLHVPEWGPVKVPNPLPSRSEHVDEIDVTVNGTYLIMLELLGRHEDLARLQQDYVKAGKRLFDAIDERFFTSLKKAITLCKNSLNEADTCAAPLLNCKIPGHEQDTGLAWQQLISRLGEGPTVAMAGDQQTGSHLPTQVPTKRSDLVQHATASSVAIHDDSGTGPCETQWVYGQFLRYLQGGAWNMIADTSSYEKKWIESMAKDRLSTEEHISTLKEGAARLEAHQNGGPRLSLDDVTKLWSDIMSTIQITK
jgi:hypothetical protein